jgi:hypothetical protein
MDMAVAYIESIKKQFWYYKTIAENAIDQLEEKQLFCAANDDSNNMAVIINHLYGNMLSRWTDFLTTDGEKEWRNRDAEFENPAVNKKELMMRWEAGWACLFNALEEVTPDNLNTIIYIRNEGHTVIEALNRQLAHYSYHIGQLVYAAKQIKATAWESLSIPKNKSAEYNTEKFAEEKQQRNFIDEALNKFRERGI